MNSVQRQNSKEDKNVITYTYPLKRNKNIAISF